MFAHRAWFTIGLDDESARVMGLPVTALNSLLAVLTAVTIVAATRIVGVLLVAALMVLPVASARIVARSQRQTLLFATVTGVISAVIGLGTALYSRGNYDDAVKALLRGADLNPSDPRCYLFLAKAYDSSPSQADEVIQRFKRFAELQPQNARSHYYYAMSLWKGKRAQDPDLDLQQIESLLKKSIALDPKLAEAHLQLGNLYSDQSKYADAIPEYVQARELNPDLADAYYRLGQAYVHTGAKDRAQEQFAVYQRLRTQHLADLDKQRAEIRQFVYSEKDGAPAKQ